MTDEHQPRTHKNGPSDKVSTGDREPPTDDAEIRALVTRGVDVYRAELEDNEQHPDDALRVALLYVITTALKPSESSSSDPRKGRS